MGFCSTCGEIVRTATGRCDKCEAQNRTGVAVESATSGLEPTSAAIAQRYADQYMSAGFRGGVEKGLGRMLGNRTDDSCNEYCIDCQRHITNAAEIFVGPAIAGGHVYCETCYGAKFAKGICETCRKPVLGLGFEHVSQDGKLWHQQCFQQSSSARACAECTKVIYGQGISALDRWWHPECFKCFNCQTVIHGSFLSFNGNPCCRLCNDAIGQSRPDVAVRAGAAATRTQQQNEEIARKNAATRAANAVKQDFVNNKTVGNLEDLCDECLAPVRGNSGVVRVSNGTQFHAACFKCGACGKQISGDVRYVVEGRTAYHPTCRVVVPRGASNLRCKACNGAISAQFVKVDTDVYHPACFKCSVCSKAIGTGAFGELPGRGPACEACLTRPAQEVRTISATVTLPRGVAADGSVATNVGGFTVNPITGKREERLPGGALKNPSHAHYGH